MPPVTKARQQRRRAHAPSSVRERTEDDHVAQLQCATQDTSPAGGSSSATHEDQEAPVAQDATTVTDGARKTFAAGSDYTSLRLLTRRAPADPSAVVAGVDTSSADLSWTAVDPSLDPSGKPWLYPKTRGKGEGSNLRHFREEIEKMTKDGQGCQAIADVLIAKGVDTSSRAVARQRIKWGLRQRAPRKMTEQGLANIRKAHLEQAKRLANSDPVPVKRVRIRVMRKAEITRMTKEGMTAAEIAENLISRGVTLRRGAATVERLRTIWGLTDDSQRSVINLRAAARNQAQRQQKEQFENIAKDLGIEDIDTWVKNKMDENIAQEVRRQYAYVLMGDAKPKPLTDEQKKARLDDLRRSRSASSRSQAETDLLSEEGPEYSHLADAATDSAFDIGTGDTPDANTILDDGGDIGVDTEDEEAEMVVEDVADPEVHTTSRAQELSQMPTGMETSCAPIQLQFSHVGNHVQHHAPPSEPTIASTPLHGIPFQTIMNSSLAFDSGQQHGSAHEQTGADLNMTDPSSTGIQSRSASSANHTPRFAGHGLNTLRAIAPRPTAAPSMISSTASKVEANFMAQFGLFPFPTQGKPPQKYLTPTGLITTDGYEYLAAGPLSHGVPTLPSQAAQVQPLSGTDYIVVPATPSPPRLSTIPAPPLVMSPEEIARHKSDHDALCGYQKVAQECTELLAARASGRPILNSLTGLPPSLGEIETAKKKVKEMAAALLDKF